MRNVTAILALGAMLGCGEAHSLSPEQAELTAPLVGTWKLVEALADPGNGSGRFVPVAGFLEERHTFWPDGRYTVESSNEVSFKKRFWLYRVIDEERIDMVYVSNSTEYPTSTWRYTDLTDSTVTLNYGCVEGCGGKYVRLK